VAKFGLSRLAEAERCSALQARQGRQIVAHGASHGWEGK